VQAATDNLGLIVLSWTGIKPFEAKFALDCRLKRFLVKMVLQEILAKKDRRAFAAPKGLAPAGVGQARARGC
jgi:hypothetical protein